MRFTESGPSIPLELLTARDQGEVVFFCGAGVSMPAGLLSFFELTVQAMKKLGVHPDSKVGRQMERAIVEDDPDLAPPFDQVFGQLQRIYTVEKIEREVTQLLKTPRKAETTNHEVVLRLSTDETGKPFVVTTNFDRLFEKARAKLPYWVPPGLPLMSGDVADTGIVYLHGRLESSQKNDGRVGGLVLGSGDFGRAYLADGWATNFFRKLLERKTVVLLGYSAGDPPIRYLLEGLHSSTSARLKPIYAFDRGEESEVISKWEGLGVTGIPFNGFQDLWSSLTKWAERADDPAKWREGVLQLARQSPRDLKPYERGQVAALISTPDGAKAFADSNPSPPAEWVCVFDASTRYRNPFDIKSGRDTVTIDPLCEFGLDDDPARIEESKARGVDFLGQIPSDTDTNTFVRLTWQSSRQMATLPSRLWSLTRWFENIADDPTAIWWAARQINLHQQLIWSINRRLAGHGRKFSEDAFRAWGLLLEIEAERGDDLDDLRWFDFTAKLKQTGWNSGALRAFDWAIKPRLKVDLHRETCPIFSSEVSAGNVLKLSLHCPSRHGEDIEIPNDILPRVMISVTRALERAADLLEETGRTSRFFRLPAIVPDERPGERFVSQDGPDSMFLWAVELFRKLAECNVEEARRQVLSWPEGRFFFHKFRLFAWGLNDLIPAEDVADGLRNFPDEQFWDPYLERDILHTLRARWSVFSPEIKEQIELRISRPVFNATQGDDAENERRRKYDIGSRLGWLERNGCTLSQLARHKLEEIRALETWTERHETNADHDMDGRTSWVERRSEPKGLQDELLANIIPRAKEFSGRDHQMFVEHAPFEGVVETRPSRALAALANQSRLNLHPIEYWQQLLSKWPSQTDVRLVALCGLRVIRLPQSVQFELRHYIPNWIRDHLQPVNDRYPSVFLDVWDGAFQSLVASGPDATESAIGDSFVAGKPVRQSRKTISHAINGPICRLVEALFGSFGERNFVENEGLPREITIRFERCLHSPGEGADHAATIICRRLSWLHYVDPNWTKTVIFSLFNLDDAAAEAAWNGLLFQQRVPSHQVFSVLKKDFLRIFTERGEWLLEDGLDKSAITILVTANYFNRKGKRYISDEECRRTLQVVSDTARQNALWAVRRIVGEDHAWKTFGERFFSHVWPQEAQYQTSRSSSTIMLIANDHSEIFPRIVNKIKEYLRPIDHPDTFIFRQRKKDANDGEISMAMKWPREVLDVTNRVISLQPSYVPHDLPALLEDIAEAQPKLRNTTAWRRLNGIVTG